MPEPNNTFRAAYPAGPQRARYQKAIRAELAGGSELLDLIEWTNTVQRRKNSSDPPDWEAWEVLSEKIQAIRNAMVEDIKDHYNIP